MESLGQSQPKCSKVPAVGHPPTIPEVWGVFFGRNFAKVVDKHISILVLEHDFEDDLLNQLQKSGL